MAMCQNATSSNRAILGDSNIILQGQISDKAFANQTVQVQTLKELHDCTNLRGGVQTGLFSKILNEPIAFAGAAITQLRSSQVKGESHE